MSVTFTSTALGAVAGALTLTDNAVGSPQSVTLTGTGVIPFARLSAASINFGNQVLGARAPPATITMTNVGLGNLLVTTEAIGGVNAGDFATTADTFTGAILPSYASCSVGVTFTPSAMGKRAGTLTFTDNASNSPQTVALSGTSLIPAPFLNPFLAPTSVMPGGAGFTLTVTGSNFVSGAAVRWNGSALATTVVNPGQFTAVVPGANIASPGTAAISVVNPGSGLTSNLAYLPISAPMAAVAVTSAPGAPIPVGLTPGQIAVGDFNGDGKPDVVVANSGA